VTWERYYIAKDNLIEIRTWGNVTIGHINYSRDEVIRLSKEKIVESVLIDAIDVESLPEKSSLSGFVDSLFDTEILTETKFALLICMGRWHDFQNIEEFCEERGFPVKVFLSRQRALEWLKE
jgi:hypothetical protein